MRWGRKRFPAALERPGRDSGIGSDRGTSPGRRTDIGGGFRPRCDVRHRRIFFRVTARPRRAVRQRRAQARVSALGWGADVNQAPPLQRRRSETWSGAAGPLVEQGGARSGAPSRDHHPAATNEQVRKSRWPLLVKRRGLAHHCRRPASGHFRTFPFPVRVERSRDTHRDGAKPMGVSTSAKGRSLP